MTDIISSMENVLTHLKDGGESIIEEVGTGLTSALNTVGVNFGDTLRDSITNVKTGVDAAGSIIQTGANQVWDKLSDQRALITNIINNFVTMIDSLIQQIVQTATDTGNGIARMADQFAEQISKIAASIDSVVANIKNNVLGVLPSVTNEITTMFNNVRSVVSQMVPQISAIVNEIANHVQSIVDEIYFTIHDIAQNIRDLVSETNQALDNMMIRTENNLNEVFNTFDRRANTLRTTCTDGLDSVNTSIQKIENAFSLTSVLKGMGMMIVGMGLCILASILIVRFIKRK